MPFLLVLLAACGQSGNWGASESDSLHPNQGAAAAARKDGANLSGCYLQVSGRDSIRLVITQQKDSVFGTLQFDNYEKDASQGTVNGSWHDGLLRLWYNFSSEGTQSVMLVIFKPVPDGLSRASGEYVSRGDSTWIREESGLSFPEKEVLRQVACP